MYTNERPTKKCRRRRRRRPRRVKEKVFFQTEETELADFMSAVTASATANDVRAKDNRCGPDRENNLFRHDVRRTQTTICFVSRPIVLDATTATCTSYSKKHGKKEIFYKNVIITRLIF